jgi:hypothetical protein
MAIAVVAVGLKVSNPRPTDGLVEPPTLTLVPEASRIVNVSLQALNEVNVDTAAKADWIPSKRLKSARPSSIAAFAPARGALCTETPPVPELVAGLPVPVPQPVKEAATERKTALNLTQIRIELIPVYLLLSIDGSAEKAQIPRGKPRHRRRALRRWI